MPQCRRFDGKVAVVTGGSRGIGLAIARRLVAEGARVCVTGREADALADAVDTLGATHAMAACGRADDTEHVQRALEEVKARFGPVDLLINNAGINPTVGPMLEQEPSLVRKVFEVNFIAALEWSRAAWVAAMRDRGGSILFVSSITALGPADGIGVYGTSKAALVALTRQLGLELAPLVRVNALAPALIKTRFAAALYEGRESEVVARYPLGRLGSADDVAGAATFLLSNDAAWVTGQVLVVDGGFTLS